MWSWFCPQEFSIYVSLPIPVPVDWSNDFPTHVNILFVAIAIVNKIRNVRCVETAVVPTSLAYKNIKVVNGFVHLSLTYFKPVLFQLVLTADRMCPRISTRALPAAGRCLQGSWAGHSTLEHCPMRGAAGPLWSCRTMMSPCNRWAGEERESKRILACHCLTFTVHTVYLNRAGGEKAFIFTGSQLGRQKETYPALTCPG